ncbi:MAG TPA: PLP-dependent aminotransferase family protein [Planctomycetota bacterium]|jgi:2-aminoadipate transaminase|nr:PLP-dependent aminotransferase family protein [Planctomycetota bacterium]
MQLPLDRSSERPLREQITAALRERIESGELAAGARLPSSRELADRLHVNRTTVVDCFQDLRAAGLLETGVGRGTFVAERGAARTLRVRGPAQKRGAAKAARNGAAARGGEAAASPDFVWSRWLAHARPLPRVHAPGAAGTDARIPLSRAVGHPDLFPVDRITAALDGAFAHGGRRLLDYPSPAGFEPLREALRARFQRQGVATDRNEIVIVNGSQQGLDLVARLLLADGGTVVTSRPSFSGALDVFRWHRASLVGLPYDTEGFEPAPLDRALGGGGARLIYAIPDRHNPTGLTLSEAGRERLMAAARLHGAAILEDDWLAELSDPSEPAPLKARDTTDQVIYLGTFSKVLAPGLRIGWLLVPKVLFEPLLALKKTCDNGTNLPAQAVVHELLASGSLDEHVKGLRKQFESRRARVDAAIDAHFPKEARPRRPHSGMVTWIDLPRGSDVNRIVAEASRAGVEITAGAPFDPAGGALDGFRLSYATAAESDLEPALARLGRVLKSVLHGAGAATAPPLV